MLLDFVECDSLVWPLRQEKLEEILTFARYVFGDLQLGRPDAIVQFLDVLRVVGRKPDQELVQDCAYLVDVG